MVCVDWLDKLDDEDDNGMGMDDDDGMGNDDDDDDDDENCKDDSWEWWWSWKEVEERSIGIESVITINNELLLLITFNSTKYGFVFLHSF